MSKKANPTLIGLFILGTLALTVVGVVALVPRILVADRPVFVSFFHESVNGLNVGASVKFQGVPVGEVVEIGLRIDPRDMTSSAPVRYRINIQRLQTAMRDHLDLDDQAVLEAHVDGGLRAQLQVESIVTGLLFVNLEYMDDPPPIRARHYAQERVIPTAPSPLMDLEDEVRELAAAGRQVLEQAEDVLQRLDFEEVAEAMITSARAVERLAEAPEIREALVTLPELAEDLTATMAEVQLLAARVGAAIDPFELRVEEVADEAGLLLQALRETIEAVPAALTTDTGIGYRIDEALNSLAEAADAIRRLVTALEEDPSMLIRGRTPEPDLEP